MEPLGKIASDPCVSFLELCVLGGGGGDGRGVGSTANPADLDVVH